MQVQICKVINANSALSTPSCPTGIRAPAEAAHEKHGHEVLQEGPAWMEEASMLTAEGMTLNFKDQEICKILYWIICFFFALDDAEGCSQWDLQGPERQLPSECGKAVFGL